MTVAGASLSPRSQVNIAAPPRRMKRAHRAEAGEWCRFEGCDVKAHHGKSLCDLHTDLAEIVTMMQHDDAFEEKAR
jgi:hypothetical protein